MNLSVPVPGYLQSNQRAELLAVALACLRDPRPLDVRSDSDYVSNGFATRGVWPSQGGPGDHADLWNILAEEMPIAPPMLIFAGRRAMLRASILHGVVRQCRTNGAMMVLMRSL